MKKWNEQHENINERQIDTNLNCKIVSSLDKVFPKKEPEECENTLVALKGETVSFQIAYFWEGKNKIYGDISETTIESCSVKDAQNLFSIKDISIRKVLLVPCQYTNHAEYDDDYLITEPGVYPDLLREMDSMGFPVVSDQWRSLWIDFNIPKDAAAGIYEVSFVLRNNTTVNSEEVFKKTAAVRLEILDYELPELDIPHTEWLHCDCLAQYYKVPVFSDEHWRIIEKFITTAVKRSCNMIYTPLFTPPLDTAIGGERLTVQLVDVYLKDNKVTPESDYEFGFDKFEYWVALGEKCGIKYFEMSHLFTQWGARSAPKIMAVVENEIKQIFGWNTEACGKEYVNFLSQFLKALNKEIHKLGIQDRVYFHISDEPSKDQIGTYMSAKEQVIDYLKDYHLIDAISNYEFYEKHLIDEPVCSSDHIKDFLTDEKRPEILWVYYCTVQNLNVSNRFIAMPGSRTRILGDMIYRHRIDGFLHWGFNFYNSQYSLYAIDPYQITDADGAFPAGDPFLVYPGENGTPEESIRIMIMKEAFSDYRALKLLEKLTNRNEAIACLDEKVYGQLTFDHYPHQEDYVVNVRKMVNQRIKEAIEKTNIS